MSNIILLKPEIVLTQSLTLSPTTLMQDMLGESALLNLGTEIYFSQNSIATQMLLALINSDSIAVAYEKLLNQFDVEAERLQSDLLTFIQQLLDAGLVDLKATTIAIA